MCVRVCVQHEWACVCPCRDEQAPAQAPAQISPLGARLDLGGGPRGAGAVAAKDDVGEAAVHGLGRGEGVECSGRGLCCGWWGLAASRVYAASKIQGCAQTGAGFPCPARAPSDYLHTSTPPYNPRSRDAFEPCLIWG